MVLIKIILIFAIINVGYGAFMPAPTLLQQLMSPAKYINTANRPNNPAQYFRRAGVFLNPTIETLASKMTEETCPRIVMKEYSFQKCDKSFWKSSYCKFLLQEIVQKFQEKYGTIIAKESHKQQQLTTNRM